MKIVTTLSNIFFIAIAFLVDFQVGKYFIALGLASGIHHWVGSTQTLYLDYWAMYMVGLIMVAIPFGIPLYAAPIAAFLLILAAATYGRLREFLIAIIAVAFIGLGYFEGLQAVYDSSVWLGIAFVFNYLGDQVHRKDHSIFHSGWHMTASKAILVAITYLS